MMIASVQGSFTSTFIYIFGAILYLLIPSLSTGNELYIGSGETGTFSNFAGRNICHAIETYNQNIKCHVMANADTTHNVTNLLGGSLDLALLDSKRVFDAFHQSGSFSFLDINFDDLRLLLPFYREPVSFIVRKDAKISSVEKLTGKRINVGPTLSVEKEIFSQISKLNNWNSLSFPLLENYKLESTESFMALRSGKIQAKLHIGMHPNQRIARNLRKNHLMLIGIGGELKRELLDSKSGFCSCDISGGIYANMDNRVNTVGLQNLIITTADMDNETVGLILKALFSQKQNLQQAHPSFMLDHLDIESMNSHYLHPHPEAVLFLQENIHRL